MVGGIFAALPQVVGAGDDLAVLRDHRADGDLAEVGGDLCLVQRGTHQFFIGHTIPQCTKIAA